MGHCEEFLVNHFITTQAFKSVPPVTRYNATAKKQHIAMEGNSPDFTEPCTKATRYGFLYLDMEKIKKVCRNFDELIYDRDASKSEEAVEKEEESSEKGQFPRGSAGRKDGCYSRAASWRRASVTSGWFSPCVAV